MAEQGELQRGTLNPPSYLTASQTDHKGLYFTRRQLFQVALLPDPSGHQWMSGVTMLVRWLCSSPASERLLWWVCKPRSSPASENAPLGKKGHVNQQAASFQRPPKRPAQVVLLSLDCARNAPYYLDKVRVREGAVGPSFSQTASSRVPGYGGGPETGKKQRQRQATYPEENRQREITRSPS